MIFYCYNFFSFVNHTYNFSQDARLWNRLGATLANGQKCEEAIEAYYNALQLCPGFVRARYNLGITCIHLNTYRLTITFFTKPKIYM